MDKNMIKIDDLLKERLAYGEEKERPGAWLQMRELLDKEMPVNKVPVAAFRWRRMFGYVAALLLVSAVGIGGYQMVSSMNSGKEVYNDLVNNLPENNSFKVNHNKQNTPDNTLGDTSNPFRSKEQAENNINSGNTGNDADSHLPGMNDGKEGNNNSALAESASATGASASNTPATGRNKTTSPSANKQKEKDGDSDKLLNNSRKNALIASINSDNAVKEPVLTESIKSDDQTQQNALATEGKRAFGSSSVHTALNKQKLSAGNTRSVQEPSKPAAANMNTTANGKSQQPIPESSKTGKKTVANTVNPDYLVSKQVVPRIELRETYDRKHGWRMDTISTGKAEMEILTPAEKAPANVTATSAEKQRTTSLAGNDAKGTEPAVSAKRNRPLITVTEDDNTTDEIVPAAAVALNTDAANEKLVPLSNFKISSAQRGNYARTNLIEQMVQNAKMNLGSAKFYGGVIGGVNTSLSGNNSTWGFQLGLSGTLSLNERWGIVSELKYLHRFNSQALRNDGYANLDKSAPINGVVTYTWDSVNRSFKFPTLSAMELPVYIRYSLNRLNFHAGMNLVYNFKVNNIDIDSFGIRKTNNEGPAMQGAVNYSFQGGVPRIDVRDFSSRFSLGYMFGVGYQFTPAIQLDVRMTKSFWDNAKTDGAKEVSKRLYDVPSVQVNLNYRFGRSKFRPYHKQ